MRTAVALILQCCLTAGRVCNGGDKHNPCAMHTPPLSGHMFLQGKKILGHRTLSTLTLHVLVLPRQWRPVLVFLFLKHNPVLWNVTVDDSC